MTIIGWVAAHTGLPSLHVNGVDSVAIGDGRSLAEGLGGRETVVSDPFAPPGMPVVYMAGGDSVTLTREIPDGVVDVVSDRTGRPVPGVCWSNEDDPEAWPSSVVRFGKSAARWAIEDPPITGSATFDLEDHQIEPLLRSVLRTHGVVLLAPGVPTPGVPGLRVVTIDKVSRTRATWSGQLQVSVDWTEASASGAAPVVTWGEWAGLGRGWEHVSVLDLAREIAGMPS